MITTRSLLTLSLGMIATGAGVWLASQKSTGVSSPQSRGMGALWQLNLSTVDEQTLALASFKGKPLLVNFWATWCAPCIEEMPLLNQFHLASAKKSNGLQLLGIAVDKSESVLKFLNATPVQFPIALAGFEGIALSQKLGNMKGGLPFSILISKEEAILFKKEGQLTANDLKMIEDMMGHS